MYEVWSALAVPNVFIDIEDVIDKKIELIEMYKSQIQTRDYVNKIRSLNSYRALSVQKEYVETYTRLDVNDFKKICKMYTI
jgi:LmbE family N-acetylglucosaminyl deacetylase